jgi:hypothetical protein
MFETLCKYYPDRIIKVDNNKDISNTVYVVYILIFNGTTIVLGRGKKNRAKVILDSSSIVTKNHIKSMLIRIYTLFGEGQFERYIICCDNIEEAKSIEKNLHSKIGGNNCNLPEYLHNKLFEGIHSDSPTYLFLKLALRSSYSGISDLYKWRKDNLINDQVWSEISKKLNFKN